MMKSGSEWSSRVEVLDLQEWGFENETVSGLNFQTVYATTMLTTAITTVFQLLQWVKRRRF